MINILVDYKDSKIVKLTVKGHADSAPYGKDLVCAAISAIVTGGANALHEIDNNESNVKIHLAEGNVSFQLIDSNDQIINQTLNTILIMLKTVKETNPDFIKIKEN